MRNYPRSIKNISMNLKVDLIFRKSWYVSWYKQKERIYAFLSHVKVLHNYVLQRPQFLCHLVNIRQIIIYFKIHKAKNLLYFLLNHVTVLYYVKLCPTVKSVSMSSCKYSIVHLGASNLQPQLQDGYRRTFSSTFSYISFLSSTFPGAAYRILLLYLTRL